MAISIVSSTRQRFPVGNRTLVTFIADDVDSTGSYVAAASIGLKSIDAVLAAQPEDATVAIQASKNSQTAGGLEDDPGDLFLKSASTTTDVHVAVLGR